MAEFLSQLCSFQGIYDTGSQALTFTTKACNEPKLKQATGAGDKVQDSRPVSVVIDSDKKEGNMSTKKLGSHTPVKLLSTTEQIRRLETQLEISRQEKDNLLKEVIILRGFFDMAKIEREMKKENPKIVEFDYTQLYMDALKSAEHQLKEYQDGSHECVCRSDDDRRFSQQLKRKDIDYTELMRKYLVLERKNKELESRLPEIETNRNLYDKELKETEVLREKLAEAKRQLNEHRERLALFEVKLPSIFGNSTRKREQSVNELEYKLNALQKELEKEKKYSQQLNEMLSKKDAEIKEQTDAMEVLNRQLELAKSKIKLIET